MYHSISYSISRCLEVICISNHACTTKGVRICKDQRPQKLICLFILTIFTSAPVNNYYHFVTFPGTSAAGALPIEPDPSSIEFAPNGTLIIHSASLQHKGHFTCEVDNGIGNPLRKTIFLMVNGVYSFDLSITRNNQFHNVV